MSSLSANQKELIFDYCVGVVSGEQAEQIRLLINSSAEAGQLFFQLRAVLSPLDSWQVEACPESLVERTVERLDEAAEEGHIKLEHLLASEEARSERRAPAFWAGLGGRLAVAAAFVIAASLVLQGARYLGYKADKIQCQAQLANFWRGVSNYSADHDGLLPAVAMPSGAPWWKIGHQGQENHSNTRNIWLLVKGEYVGPNDFICPGKKVKGLKPLDEALVQTLDDFPDRRYIAYSFRVICNGPVRISGFGRRVLISDLNPLFESLPSDYGQSLHITLDDQMLRLNSVNHKRKGQNVLFGDGSVKFHSDRRAEITNDDIFTLRDKRFYQGFELPTCETDAFLAP